MTQLKEYVKNEKETEIVSTVRKDYVKKYADFLIDKGNIKEGRIVVDIPCGTGDMAKAIAEKVNVGRFVLIDLNKNMVESAKKKVTKNAIFIVGDAGDIGSLVNFKVDTIICLNGFHQYISQKESFLKGCNKILKKNGRLIFDISTRGLNDEYTSEFLNKQRMETIKLSEKHNARTQLPVWPDKNIIKKYKDMVLKNDLRLLKEKEFTSFKTVTEFLSDAIIIPGRSRPWIPGLDYDTRKSIIKQSVENTVEKIGRNNLEHNRIFFISEKI